MNPTPRSIEILLVEDSPTDVLLTRKALEAHRVINQLNVVSDGEEAMAYLRRERQYAGRERPGLILLDLNLPRKSGLEVLQEIKSDPELKTIPVIILTTSKTEEDILKSYGLHANCYLAKPVEFVKFTETISVLREFWLSVVTLPPAR